jgi:hypothetical protein
MRWLRVDERYGHWRCWEGPPSVRGVTAIKELRANFASTQSDQLAQVVAPTLKRRPQSRGWTTHAVWYEGDDALLAVVGAQEGMRAEVALSHGLFHAHSRDVRLILVLPREWVTPTRRRVPWLNYPVEIWDYNTVADIERSAPLTRERIIRTAGDHERSPALHLSDVASDRVRPLAEWAASQPDLEPAHRRDLRVWSCNGQRVLTIKGNSKTVITAGIDAKSESAPKLVLSAALGDEMLDQVKASVLQGMQDARAKKYGGFDEHRLQQQLRSQPHLLRLEHPLLREVPAWRPAGGDDKLGRGFIDLAGLDSVGDLVIVETKLGADDMLVLQGLDYWIWALGQANRDWLVQRLHGDPKHARTRLLYAIAGKHGAAPAIDRYCRAHLDLLDPTVSWRVALISNWEYSSRTRDHRAPEIDLPPERTPPT